MKNSVSDIECLRKTYSAARNRFKPDHVNVLIIAEAPPCTVDRFFYFEDVKKQDSLFLEIMGVLYPDEKQRYMKSGRATEIKEELLQNFKLDGYWLLDLSDVPTSLTDEPLDHFVPLLISRLEKYIDRNTPVILIKANVYDSCYEPLKASGYRVINERIPFPGSGQQGVFREKFKRALELV